MAGIHYRQSFVVLGQHLKHSLRRVLLEGLKLLVGNDIDQEVKNLGVVDTGVNVALLEGSALAIQREGPRAVGQFNNEHFAGLGKQNRRLGGNHLRGVKATLTSSSLFMIFLIRAKGS